MIEDWDNCSNLQAERARKLGSNLESHVFEARLASGTGEETGHSGADTACVPAWWAPFLSTHQRSGLMSGAHAVLQKNTAEGSGCNKQKHNLAT